MSVFVTCDATVTIDGSGYLVCSGNWSTVEDTTVLNSGTLTPAEWRHVWDQLVWVFLAAATWIVLTRLINRLSKKEESSDA